MKDERLQQMMDDIYDDSKEDGLMAMVRDFYNRRMMSIVITIWAWGIACMGVAIYSGIMFFRVEGITYQLMHATIFLVMCGWVGLVKVLAWQIINRNNLKREIKRLELRVAELAGLLKKE